MVSFMFYFKTNKIKQYSRQLKAFSSLPLMASRWQHLLPWTQPLYIPTKKTHRPIRRHGPQPLPVFSPWRSSLIVGIQCGRVEMFHVIKRCLVPSLFTRTVSPALTRLEPVAARRSPTLRRDFAVKFSPCWRHRRANSSQCVQTRRFTEQSSERDGYADVVNEGTTENDRRNEGSVLVEVSMLCL